MISYIISICFLVALIVGSGISMGYALHTGVIKYGYKYYQPGRICYKKKDPMGYWLGIILYLAGIATCFVLIAFVLKQI